MGLVEQTQRRADYLVWLADVSGGRIVKFPLYSFPAFTSNYPLQHALFTQKGEAKPVPNARACLASENNLRNKSASLGDLKVSGSQVQLSLQQPEQTLILENSIGIAKLYFNRVLCAPSAKQEGRASWLSPWSSVSLLCGEELQGEAVVPHHTKTLARASAPALAI